MFERGGGGPKRVGGLGVLPEEKKIQSFTFLCLKWPILTEKTVKYRKYFLFLPTRGGYPPCGAEWGGGGGGGNNDAKPGCHRGEHI